MQRLFVLVICWLICCPAETIAYVIVQTPDPFPQNVITRTGWSRVKILDDEHSKSLYSPSVPIIFPQMQKSFPSVLPKIVYPVSLRMHNKSAQSKPAKHKKKSRGKTSKWSSTIVSKTYNLEAKKIHSGVRKRLRAH